MDFTNSRPKVPLNMVFNNYLSQLVFIFMALINEFLNLLNIKSNSIRKELNRNSYPKLYSNFHNFYYNNINWRFLDVFYFPICSVAGHKIQVLERKFGPYNQKYKITGRKIEAINFGSYNYLGFAQNTGAITDSVENTIRQLGVGICSTANEVGRQQIYCTLEAMIANFLGTEDAVVFGMGFATNAYTMFALFGKGCLVISDQLNHASLVLGCRMSGAHIQVFKHNDMTHLEQIVRNCILEGQPRTGRSWVKIVVIVEGIYSMEGTVVNLPEVLRIKKKYKLYVYLDEAHSIGAIGSRGRGVCDYYNCDPKDVDILMGTFTKSFAAAGGYMGANKTTIAYLRSKTAAFNYGPPIAPPIVQQIQSALIELCGSHRRIKQLNENTVYFRQKLKELGFHIDGNNDSPVIPLMVYLGSYGRYFVKRLLDSGIATIGIGYPVTNLLGIRLRLCVSASHTREMLDIAIHAINTIGSEISINFDKK